MRFSRTLLEKLTTADCFCRHVCTRHTAFRFCTHLPKAALKLHPDNDLQKAPLCYQCTIWTGFPQSFTNTTSFCGQVCLENCFDFLSAGKSVRSYMSRHKTICALFGQVFLKVLLILLHSVVRFARSTALTSCQRVKACEATGADMAHDHPRTLGRVWVVPTEFWLKWVLFSE